MFSAAPGSAARKTLDFYFIDVEGGQATLIVTPAGESLLVDTGWNGFNGRDAERIVKAAKDADLKHIDYVLITHHHMDHVGGAAQLAERFPVRAFIDHGDNTETGRGAELLQGVYAKALAASKRIQVKAGDKLPLKGIQAEVVSARGGLITTPLTGAGQPNPLCAGEARRADDPSENALSVGFLLTHGKFRFVNLGDLTWNKELELACPNNKLGQVDLYLTTHHGMNISGPKAIVHALNPRVAIMNNGAKKGGTPEAYQVIRSSPRLQDLWQLHFAVAGGSENNTAEAMIANPAPDCNGFYLKASVDEKGVLTVTNQRNKYSKSY